MNRRSHSLLSRSTLAATFAVALLAFVSPAELAADGAETAASERPAPADPAEEGERETTTYVGQIIDNSNTLPRVSSARLEIRLDELTSKADGEALDRSLDEAEETGEDAEAEDEESSDEPVGSISIGHGLAYPIAAAFERESAEDERRHLVFLIRRTIDIREIFSGSPSTRYPYTVVELNLGPDGEGSGQFIPAADVDVVGGDHLVIDQFSTVPLWIIGVREQD